jgi:carbonic anhydrase/acetyltransferase-like protein (isoleucine patch superfamily)
VTDCGRGAGYGERVPIYALGDRVPNIHPDAFVHPDAVIIGSVTIGADASIWPCAVLRGDAGRIVIGSRTSIQDGSVLHTTPQHPTVVGDDCVVGHIVHLEGCTIEDGVLIGNGSVVMHRVVVHTGAMVGANSVVLDDTDIPAGALAVGSPVTIKPGQARRGRITQAAEAYVWKSGVYRRELVEIDRAAATGDGRNAS